LDGYELAPKLWIDADVPLVEMTSETMQWLQRLEPCGEENPVPLFQSRGVHLSGYAAVGREEQHLKLAFPDNTEVRDAIGFGMGDRVKQLDEQPGECGHKCVDIVYSLAVNDWDGESRLQLRLRDVRPATL
jgi:single-stranded-DNA-specific exonuclease